jgi:hypothetical protein
VGGVEGLAEWTPSEPVDGREFQSYIAPVSPEVARRVLQLFRKIRPSERVEYDLTPHELRLSTLMRRATGAHSSGFYVVEKIGGIEEALHRAAPAEAAYRKAMVAAGAVGAA